MGECKDLPPTSNKEHMEVFRICLWIVPAKNGGPFFGRSESALNRHTYIYRNTYAHNAYICTDIFVNNTINQILLKMSKQKVQKKGVTKCIACLEEIKIKGTAGLLDGKCGFQKDDLTEMARCLSSQKQTSPQQKLRQNSSL